MGPVTVMVGVGVAVTVGLAVDVGVAVALAVALVESEPVGELALARVVAVAVGVGVPVAGFGLAGAPPPLGAPALEFVAFDVVVAPAFEEDALEERLLLGAAATDGAWTDSTEDNEVASGRVSLRKRPNRERIRATFFIQRSWSVKSNPVWNYGCSRPLVRMG